MAEALMTRRISDMKRVNDILIAKLSDDPDTIGPAIDQFVEQFDNRVVCNCNNLPDSIFLP